MQQSGPFQDANNNARIGLKDQNDCEPLLGLNSSSHDAGDNKHQPRQTGTSNEAPSGDGAGKALPLRHGEPATGSHDVGNAVNQGDGTFRLDLRHLVNCPVHKVTKKEEVYVY